MMVVEGSGEGEVNFTPGAGLASVRISRSSRASTVSPPTIATSGRSFSAGFFSAGFFSANLMLRFPGRRIVARAPPQKAAHANHAFDSHIKHRQTQLHRRRA